VLENRTHNSAKVGFEFSIFQFYAKMLTTRLHNFFSCRFSR